MLLDWEELKISQAELNRIFEPNLITSWAIALGRVLLLYQPQYRSSLFLTQCSWLFIIWLFFFPVSLIAFRKLELLSSTSSGLVTVLLATASTSILVLLIFNCYLWQKAKKLKLLIKLWQKVINYNQLINDFQLLANINQIAVRDKADSQNNSDSNNSLAEFKIALKLTKNSLLKSIELESFIYRQATKSDLAVLSPSYRYQSLLNLENDLTNLSLSAIDSDTKYQELINEAVNLGLSVHQEIRKIKSLRH